MPGGKKGGRANKGGDRNSGSPGKNKEGEDRDKKEFKFDFGGGNAPKFDFSAKPEEQQNKGDDKKDRALLQLTEEAKAALVPMIQKKLHTLVGKSSGYFETLPAAVQNRIKVLKKLHFEKTKIDADYKKEMAELEKKYKEKYSPLYSKRTQIVSGEVEPTLQEISEADAEIKKKAEAEEKEENKEKKEAEKPASGEQKKEEGKTAETASSKAEEKDVKGIPQFWLEALQHNEDTGQMITEKDQEALQYLTDLKVAEVEGEDESFSLEFHFAENPFFENTLLLKTYHLEFNPIYGDVMFDHLESSEIKWKPGKNLTVKKITQKVGGGRSGRKGGKRGGKGQTQVVEVPTQSFFNFFSPDATIAALEEEEDIDEGEIQYVLEEDYELGSLIKDQIIPNAVLWFTGEAEDEDGGPEGSDDDDEDDDGAGEEEGEYNSDEDEDFVPDPNAPQPECKQQ
jgi:nucleosome assembly protein 1-like 1